MGDDGRVDLAEEDRLIEQLARFTLQRRHNVPVTRHNAVHGTVDAAQAVEGAPLAGDEIQAELGLPVAADVTADDAVAALRLIPNERTMLNRAECALIEAARDRGETWDSLGDKLGGRTAQAVQQRYRRLGGKRSWPTRRPAVDTA